MKGFKTYKHTFKKGYGPGAQASEWWTDEDWRKWKEYVQRCKDDGTYGDEFEIELHLKHHSLFDNPPSEGKEEHNFVLLDMSNNPIN